ncbi:hypothetical protein Daus18300_005961 [Diaporthe australafricana]|uniref:Uncharacterized protein n=1 Tax=Diaporthe australafricana TaxID=127596 RepID=A0ABR3WYK2_9PEZI
MVLTIEENLEEALETFARLTILGHFAQAADFFATTLEDHLQLFPIFAEYANFLVLQGRFDILLSLIERREVTDPEEKVYVGLLQALSLLHGQGQLADALKACASFDSDWIRPPEELSEIQASYCQQIIGKVVF